ncbi:MAG: hypothetical protein AB8H47_22400 [Bacteroidia bacterium]
MKTIHVSLLSLSLCVFFAFQANAQTKISWPLLAKVSYEGSEAEGNGVPVFDEMITTLDSQIVEIEGYMLPLTVDNQRYILSRYPFYNCYFCGNAGRETVIELHPKAKEWEFDIDDKVKIRGKLILVEDTESLIFELVEAEEAD